MKSLKYKIKEIIYAAIVYITSICAIYYIIYLSVPDARFIKALVFPFLFLGIIGFILNKSKFSVIFLGGTTIAFLAESTMDLYNSHLGKTNIAGGLVFIIVTILAFLIGASIEIIDMKTTKNRLYK